MPRVYMEPEIFFQKPFLKIFFSRENSRRDLFSESESLMSYKTSVREFPLIVSYKVLKIVYTHDTSPFV